MNRQNVWIITKTTTVQEQPVTLTEAWGSLKRCCLAHDFPYWTLARKKSPFEHDGWTLVKRQLSEKDPQCL